MSQWYYSLSVRSKLMTSIYFNLVLVAIALNLVILFSGGSILAGLIVTVVLAILAYPTVGFIEKALNSSFEEMSNAAFRISKGDFTQRIDTAANASLGEVGHAFNSMVDKLRDILTETSNITRHVSETSRNIFDKNNHIQIAMEQVAASSNELATGANEISEDVADMSESIAEIEKKVANYAHATKEMNERSEFTLGLVDKDEERWKRNPKGCAATWKLPRRYPRRLPIWPARRRALRQ